MSSEPNTAKLSSLARRHGFVLSGLQVAQLAAYLGSLRNWNRTINLTALPLGEDDEVPDSSLDRLIFEPLRAVELLLQTVPSLAELNGQWLDIGSGSGSPAIPMKVALCALQLTMVESRGRKVAFLREALRQAGLVGARVHAGRIEELPANGTAALISVRAVRLTSSVVRSIGAMLQSGGHFVAIGADDYSEIGSEFERLAAADPINLFRRK